MKKLFFIAAIAAITLTACGKGKETTNAAATETAQHVVSNQIAYVRIDSLMAGYEMYKELSAAFEAKAKQADADLSSRGRSLERKVADAQNKAEKGLATRAELAQLEESLGREQQSLMQLQSTKQDELAEENQVMMNKIIYSLEEYMKEFNADYRYGMIVTTSGGSPVLHADPALDITAEVLKGLNEKYARESGKGSKPAAADTTVKE